MKPQYWLAAATLFTLIPARADVGKITFTSTRDGNQEIYSMNPDGSAQTRLTTTPSVNESYPSWSHNGAKIAYGDGQDIFTMDANGTNQVALTTDGHLKARPDYSPDDSKLLYSAFGGQDQDIYVIPATGGAATRVINNQYGDYEGDWSPDGTKIAFKGFPTTTIQEEIYVCNADGSGQVRLTTTGGNNHPCWSPDGAHILFDSKRDGGQMQLYIMNADGTGQTRLTNDAFADSEGDFSPDGSKITFMSNRDGRNQIYVMNVDGTGQTRLTTDTGDDVSPNWGQTLASNAPSVSISDVTVAEGNSGTVNANFTISLSAASTAPVTVTYQTYDGTAVAGSDYVAVAPTSVVFAAGQTSKIVTVAVKGDTVNEGNETFSVRLSAVGARVANQVGVGTITNDDTPPTISINDLGVREGNSGTVNANFIVSLSAASAVPVQVSYATSDGTAFNTGLGTSSGDYNGGDYIAKTGVLTIPAGQTSAIIPVTVRGDEVIEYDETFFVNLSNPVNGAIADNQGRGLIVNDDTKPGLTISDATVVEGGTATFTLTMSHAFTAPVTISYSTADHTAVAGSDYVATTGTVVIPALQTKATFTVATINDKVPENTETFLVNVTAPDVVVTDAQGVGTITNDDLPDVSISDVSMPEGNAGAREMYFTISLSTPAPFTTQAQYYTADGVALAGSDYVGTSGTVSFAPGEVSKAVPIIIIGDTDYESDEVFSVNIGGGANVNLKTTHGQATIVNDDDPPVSAPLVNKVPSSQAG